MPAGAYNLCPTHGQRALGISADGGMAEHFRATVSPAGRTPARASTSVMRRSWNPPLSRGTCSASPEPDRAHVLRRLSARALSGCWPWPGLVASVQVLSRLQARHPFQKEAGGAPGGTCRPRTGCTTSWSRRLERKESLAKCGELVVPGGTIVVLGVHFGPVQLDWMPLFHKEARVIPSLGYCAHDGGREMEEAAAMLAEDPEIVRTLITHRFPIEDAAEAFRVASGRRAGRSVW